MSSLSQHIAILISQYTQSREVWHLIFLLFSFVMIIEWPLYFFVIAGILQKKLLEKRSDKKNIPYYPNITCFITCYNEGRHILHTLESLVEQLYPGNIEILVLIDGANINRHTVKAAKDFMKSHDNITHRYIRIIERNTRGGLASSANLGLKLAKGEIIVRLDGDCSCDNDMVAKASYRFIDSRIVGMSGTLRVRNARRNILTRLQEIEYMLGIHLCRIGLAKWDVLNNISGAFGVFTANRWVEKWYG